MKQTVRRIQATRDAALWARIAKSELLNYSPEHHVAGAPHHVRAASAIRGVGRLLVIVQDDANWLAVVEPATGAAQPIALPPGPGGQRLFSKRRGNKRDKLDLEACIVTHRQGSFELVAFGSGSLPAREKIVRVRFTSDDFPVEDASVEVIEARALYASLRDNVDFAGSELNVEGAVLMSDDRLRLFQRGNGAPGAVGGPVDASCDIDWRALCAYLDGHNPDPPSVGNLVQYDLGKLDGVRLTFTDAVPFGGEQVLFLASAEDSPDAVQDGAILGAVVGIIDAAGDARWAPLCGASGVRHAIKAEGIWVDQGADALAIVVVDPDDIDEPAQMLHVELGGSWRSG